MPWPFTLIVTSILRPDPFIHTLIWVSWASNDAHLMFIKAVLVSWPQLATCSVDLKLSSTSIIWEHWHVDTTLRSTRIFGDSGRKETSMCLISSWMSRYGSSDIESRTLFRSQRLLTQLGKRSAARATDRRLFGYLLMALLTDGYRGDLGGDSDVR
jgi:hypothetical protein